MAAFKDRLEEALQLRKMKASDLAKITGIGEGAISQYRKGAYKATQTNLEKIAVALNVPIPWLMGAVDDNWPDTSESDGPKERAHKLLDMIPEDKLRDALTYLEFLKAQEDRR